MEVSALPRFTHIGPPWPTSKATSTASGLDMPHQNARQPLCVPVDLVPRKDRPSLSSFTEAHGTSFAERRTCAQVLSGTTAGSAPPDGDRMAARSYDPLRSL